MPEGAGSRLRVAVLDDYQRVAADMADWGPLSGVAELQFFHDHVEDTDTLVRRLEAFEVIVLMRERTPLPVEILERLPNLRLIVTSGMVNAAIDLAAAQRLRVIVCGTRSAGAGTLELTWGLILACARSLLQEDRFVRDGGWQSGVGSDLAGHTLGVLGLGRIGAAVARVGLIFDMDVVAWSPNLTGQQAEACGARLLSRDELFQQADVLTVHVKLSERSRSLVTARELSLMKATAFLINTSRGPVVQEEDLVEALRDGRLAGAGLDVFDREPLPVDHPLRRLDNVVLTPHLGYVTQDNYRRNYADAVEDVVRWHQGSPIRELVPPTPVEPRAEPAA